jgi:hypothetical protein
MYTIVLPRWTGRGRSESCRDCIRVDNSLLPWPAGCTGRTVARLGRVVNVATDSHGVPRPLVL